MTASGKLYPEQPVLLVDDEDPWLRGFRNVLRAAGVTNVISCTSAREALAVIEERVCSVMTLDLVMPDGSGEEMLPQILERRPDLPVLIITGTDQVDTAVRCLKAGAVDYHVKSAEIGRLAAAVLNAIRVGGLRQEVKLLTDKVLDGNLRQPEAFAEIITAQPGMLAIFKYMEAIAGLEEPVLITGETGTGKELVARALHRLSGRAGRLVCVNVAGLDDAVFADTLFGHRKGAFTGAAEPRSGMLETAEEGTILLDEIGDLSNASQIKLLRLLQEREYYPVGADYPRRSSARVIATTHRELRDAGGRGDFRKDLYYRLNAHHIHLPPLRERLGDLPALVAHFVAQAAQVAGRPAPRVPPELCGWLATYSFPGNVRELRAMICDAVARAAGGALSLALFRERLDRAEPAETPADGPVAVPGAIVFPEPLPTIAQMEQQLIAEALRRADGNQGIAARMLGIARQTLNRKLGEERTSGGTA